MPLGEALYRSCRRRRCGMQELGLVCDSIVSAVLLRRYYCLLHLWYMTARHVIQCEIIGFADITAQSRNNVLNCNVVTGITYQSGWSWP